MWTFLLTASLGCSLGSQEVEPLPSEATLLAPVEQIRGGPCADRTPLPPLSGTARVQLLLGPGVPPELLAEQTQTAARFWADLGVELVADGPIRRAHVEAVVVGDLTHGNGREQTLRQSVAPLRAFLDEHARPPRGRIVVAMLPRIAADGSWAAVFEQLHGLTFSPGLEASLRGDASALTLGAALDLDRPHDPLIFLSAHDLQALPPWTPPLALAHELGHAFGLAHRDERSNLMRPQTSRCIPGLDRAQLDKVASALPHG